MHSLLRRFHQHGFLGSTPSSFHAPRFTSTHSLPTSPPSKEEDPPPLPSYLELPDDPIVEIKDLRSSTLYHPLIPPPINWKQGSLTQERTTEADHHLLIGVQQQGTPPLDVPSDASARAVVSRVSIDLEDARKRILRLYRHWLVKMDVILEMYHLSIPRSTLHGYLRRQFDPFKHIQDVGTLNHLIWTRQVELQETLNMWKEKTHVMRWFEGRKPYLSNPAFSSSSSLPSSKNSPTSSPPPSHQFMHRFLNGRL